jgi:homoserine O-succinyltransferase
MPLNIPDKLPAIGILQKENIFVMDTSRASSQDIRPLKIALLNLMPVKITTEIDLVRLLSNSPLQVELDFISLSSHISKNTSKEHMLAFYKDFNLIIHNKYDGLIITGAPVEQMPFEDVIYWKELTEILSWAKSNVTSSLFICWGAQAALYHYYGIPKYPLDKKMFGVFKHTKVESTNPILRGFDDVFYVPHSRYTEIRREDILKVRELIILSESEEHGCIAERS